MVVVVGSEVTVEKLVPVKTALLLITPVFAVIIISNLIKTPSYGEDEAGNGIGVAVVKGIIPPGRSGNGAPLIVVEPAI
ncbi:hypothetical protein [Niastella koreensis]|uniref:hypothetical protein n=1 Tax=Niastella koreensis TaxID=354356 RepID=UPI0013FD8C02|nr:hypothetical protein [Niastella koreensis]